MIIDFEKLLNLKKGKTRLLGMDVGEKTIGLALSDTEWSIATGFLTIKRTTFKNDQDHIEKIIKEYAVTALVMGYPLNMNGTEGPSCERVHKLAEILNDIPIHLWDERLSTVAVTRTMISADVSRKKRAEHVDKMAACFILQGVLDRCRLYKN
jgi:putative Holliday junction resolvase